MPVGQPSSVSGSLGGTGGEGKEGTGRAHRKGGESGLAGEHSESFIQQRLEKNPSSVLLLNGLTQQHKYTP